MPHNLEPRKVAVRNIFTYLAFSIEADATGISNPASGISSGIVLKHSGTELGPLSWVPEKFRHQHFCSFRYWT
jgi:hypothetical protein